MDLSQCIAYSHQRKQNSVWCPEFFGENREAGETPARARHCDWGVLRHGDRRLRPDPLGGTALASHCPSVEGSEGAEE